MRVHSPRANGARASAARDLEGGGSDLLERETELLAVAVSVPSNVASLATTSSLPFCAAYWNTAHSALRYSSTQPSRATVTANPAHVIPASLSGHPATGGGPLLESTPGSILASAEEFAEILYLRCRK